MDPRRGEHSSRRTPPFSRSNHNAVWVSVFLPMMLDREVIFMGRPTLHGHRSQRVDDERRSLCVPGHHPRRPYRWPRVRGGSERRTQALRDGELFGIYPEERAAPMGAPLRGKTGVRAGRAPLSLLR